MLDSTKMVETINQLCKENNIKIYDLEERIGVSKGNISRWANACPSSIVALYKIAEILNTSVDYILNTNYNSNQSGKAETLNNLIQQTSDRRVEWSKLSYVKAKHISVINCANELVYNSNLLVYDTIFRDKHLIFVCYSLNKKYELYIENNNEYIIICNNDSYAKRLYVSIYNEKQNVINDFFNSCT